MPDDHGQHDNAAIAPTAANPAALSQERLAALAPLLRELMADFRKLAELVTVETEPAMTPDLEGYGDGR